MSNFDDRRRPPPQGFRHNFLYILVWALFFSVYCSPWPDASFAAIFRVCSQKLVFYKDFMASCKVYRIHWVRSEMKFDTPRYSCYNPKRRNFFPSITSSIFGFFEKFLDRPSSNPETNPNPVSKQAGGKHIKSWFFTMWFSYDFGTSTDAVKSLLWLGIPLDSQILAPVYILF